MSLPLEKLRKCHLVVVTAPSPLQLDHQEKHHQTQPKKNNKQALINIYGKYDIKNTGDMDTPTFRRMCIDLITEATCVSEDQVREFNDETTLGVLVAALDMDGDGAVQKDEFVSWIMSGMNRSKNDRERFAKKNQLNERLEMFLQAVEEVVAKA